MYSLCDIKTIEQILQKHGFQFSKSLGQNFLIDASVPRNIACACGATKDYGVIEIGPGIGCLTQELAQKAGKVVSIELDQRLYPILEETMGEFENFKLIPGDVMKVDLKQLVSEELKDFTPMICANLPYNITTPVLTKLVECQLFSSLTVLIQKEVAARICAKPGTPDYGAFTLLMQYFTEPSVVFDVLPTSFIPQPKVTSSVLHCVVRKVPPVKVTNEKALFKTVRGGFALRRKTLVNSLQTVYTNYSKQQLTDIIVSQGFPADIRGERLSLEDYAKLSNALN